MLTRKCYGEVTDGVGEVLDYASHCGVVLGFEPEPGMFIDTVARAEELVERLGRPKSLGFTVDIGHLECQRERPKRLYVMLLIVL